MNNIENRTEEKLGAPTDGPNSDLDQGEQAATLYNGQNAPIDIDSEIQEMAESIANDPTLIKKRIDIHLIPFNYKFVNDPKAPDERKRNPNLKRELMSEASGILAWLVKGAMEYFENGLNPPSIVLEATKEYRENEDIVGQFIKDCCLSSTEDRVQAGALYDSYKRWCEANGYEALGTVKFSKRIYNTYPKVCESAYRKNSCRIQSTWS